jgi:hypothetical protein
MEIGGGEKMTFKDSNFNNSYILYLRKEYRMTNVQRTYKFAFLLFLIINILGRANGFADPNVRINLNTSGNQETPFLTSKGQSIYVVWQDSLGLGPDTLWGTRFSMSGDGGENWSLSNPWISDTQCVYRVYPSITINESDILYVSWYNSWFIDKSTDSGSTWGIDTHPRSDTLSTIVLPRNSSFKVKGDTIYMAFLTSPPPNPFPDFEVWFIKSEDGGLNWTTEQQISASSYGICWDVSLALDDMNNIYVVWQDYHIIGFSKSTDGGITWTSPTYNIADDGYDYPCITARGDGELFVTWVWKSDRTLCFAESDDGGATWTHPNLYIDSDLHIDPVYVYGFFDSPSICAGNTNLYIAYNDTNNIYLAMSYDTGATWAPKRTMSDVTVGNRQAPVLEVDETSGKAYVVWMDAREGDWDIYFSSESYIGMKENAIQLYKPADPLIKICPNPFIAWAEIEYQLKSRGIVRLTVYDITGSRVKEIVNELMPSGLHRAYWNGCNEQGEELPDGVYFLHLRTPSQYVTEKMVRLK